MFIGLSQEPSPIRCKLFGRNRTIAFKVLIVFMELMKLPLFVFGVKYAFKHCEFVMTLLYQVPSNKRHGLEFNPFSLDFSNFQFPAKSSNLRCLVACKIRKVN